MGEILHPLFTRLYMMARLEDDVVRVRYIQVRTWQHTPVLNDVAGGRDSVRNWGGMRVGRAHYRYRDYLEGQVK